jgi:hypothetical protein
MHLLIFDHRCSAEHQGLDSNQLLNKCLVDYSIRFFGCSDLTSTQLAVIRISPQAATFVLKPAYELRQVYKVANGPDFDPSDLKCPSIVHEANGESLELECQALSLALEYLRINPQYKDIVFTSNRFGNSNIFLHPSQQRFCELLHCIMTLGAQLRFLHWLAVDQDMGVLYTSQ